ncbi:ABC transporter-related protein [Desulfosudis oleivorans Hxd3]|uniref:ABC transporter-related protein n=2 Tax=Desulfosudis TaxID=2904716 RepID=A8ZYC3_DESOH|nr:ABC transporter-related protein [Desulfosudis oleivorans Hxd3]
MVDTNGLTGKTGMADPLIVGRDLYKGFHNDQFRVEVLTGVDIEIFRGETVAVVGASGIGKSTFLQILGALDPPDRGTLLFEGRDVYALGESELAALRNRYVGFVFQFHYLLPEFDALENVMMPVLIGSNDRPAAADAAEEILARVGLAHRLHHRPSELSGGEQQRVAIARALVLRPQIVLADEPTGNLDAKTSSRIHELLAELNGELGTTLIVATHNMGLASLMSRQMTIVDGKVKTVEDGSETES